MHQKKKKAHTFTLLKVFSWKTIFGEQYFIIAALPDEWLLTESEVYILILGGNAGGGDAGGDGWGCESGFIMLSWEWATNGAFTGFSIWNVLYFKCVLKTLWQWTHHVMLKSIRPIPDFPLSAQRFALPLQIKAADSHPPTAHVHIHTGFVRQGHWVDKGRIRPGVVGVF